MDKVGVCMPMRDDLVCKSVCVLCSDEEDEDLLEEEETEEAIDELVDESGAAENSTSDQPPAALEGDKEDRSKEIEAQKSERWLWLTLLEQEINLLLFTQVLWQVHHQSVAYQLFSHQAKELWLPKFLCVV